MSEFVFSTDPNKIKKVKNTLKASFLVDNSKNLKELNLNNDRLIEFKKFLNDISFDFTRHQVSIETLNHAKNLAKLSGVEDWIKSIFSGKIVNKSENRSSLHSALRCEINDDFSNNLIKTILKQRDKLLLFADKIRSGEIKTLNGTKYSSILSLGIGGSDLGPKMTTNALKNFSSGPIIRFVSNIDPSELHNTLNSIDPKSTLVIVSSKSFTTSETLLNARAVFRWLTNKTGEKNAKHQRIAITSNKNNAVIEGFKNHQIFTFNEWVGGRTSIWSSIGLPLAIAIGSKEFKSFLSGGRDVDNHIRKNILDSIPCHMALLGYIQRHYFEASSHAIIPYDTNLFYFPSYLQQLEMESNGKSAKINGELVSKPCVPVIWGAVGTDAQHSFFQMLHQGVEKIPIDILLARNPSFKANKDELSRHRVLAANALAQCEALSKGKINKNMNFNFPGRRSISLISYNKLDPKTLGSLIAFYEYKVIIQSALWGINPFDQFGVELGKDYAKAILNKNNLDIKLKMLDDLLKKK